LRSPPNARATKTFVGLDLSRIRIAGCGSEPINPLVLQAFAERFSHVGFQIPPH